MVLDTWLFVIWKKYSEWNMSWHDEVQINEIENNAIINTHIKLNCLQVAEGLSDLDTG